MNLNSDMIESLWTTYPRMVETMKGGSTGLLQHPHYFFAQCEKLAVLLDRIVVEVNQPTNMHANLHEAGTTLTQLLDESQCFAGMTRSSLKECEPYVRSFIGRMQEVDSFVAHWEGRSIGASVIEKSSSRKRGRCEESECETAYPTKRHRRQPSCAEQAMDTEPFGGASPASHVPMWTQPLYMQSTPWT